MKLLDAGLLRSERGTLALGGGALRKRAAARVRWDWLKTEKAEDARFAPTGLSMAATRCRRRHQACGGEPKARPTAQEPGGLRARPARLYRPALRSGSRPEPHAAHHQPSQARLNAAPAAAAAASGPASRQPSGLIRPPLTRARKSTATQAGSRRPPSHHVVAVVGLGPDMSRHQLFICSKSCFFAVICMLCYASIAPPLTPPRLRPPPLHQNAPQLCLSSAQHGM